MSNPPSNGRLANRVAVVTGAASSIGRAIALAFAAHGAKLVVADLRPTSRAEQESTPTHEVIQQRGGEALFVTTDVTDPASVGNLINEAVKAHGRLDIMVNNAGIAPEVDSPQPIYELRDKTWHATLAVNLSGVMHGIRAASQQMMKQEPQVNAHGSRGWIINTASMFGLVACGGAPSYVATKHAVMGLTKASALDLGPHSIHVNSLCPGFIDTPFTANIWNDDAPKPTDPTPGTMLSMSGPERKAMLSAMHPFNGGRMGTPDDVAGLAVFLASEDARWVTGTGIVADGGFSIQ